MKNELVEALPMLRAFARSLSGNRDRADDLVQETVMRALANRDKFQEGTNLHAWLVTILRNQYYSEVRKRRREVEDAEGTLPAASRISPRSRAISSSTTSCAPCGCCPTSSARRWS